MTDIEITNFVSDQYYPVEIEILIPDAYRNDLELNSKQFEETQDLFNQLNEYEEVMSKVELEESKEDKGGQDGDVQRLKKIKKMQLDSSQDEKYMLREYGEDFGNQNDNEQNLNEKLSQSTLQNKSKHKHVPKLSNKRKKYQKKLQKLNLIKNQHHQNKSFKSNKKHWSGEQDSDQMAEDSDHSNDSLFENLKPTKKLITHPTTKKQTTKNQSILQSLLAVGLCVEEDESKSNKEDFNNGLEQVCNMKGKKNKRPKILNKLFMDMDIKGEEKQQQAPKQMELEIKPRISSGPSSMTSSFLSKTQKWRKFRGMESQMQNEEYQKLMSLKAISSITRLISQKEVEEAEEIQLDVKVPEIVKGRGEINNSIFLKGISTEHDQLQKSASAKTNKIIDTKKIKIGRLELIRSMTDQAKSRKSRQVTHEAIKNSFKITKLQQIEDMRKKDKQKRRREALGGSYEECDEDLNGKQQVIENGQIYQKKLKLMNFKLKLEKNEVENKNNPKEDKDVNQVNITADAMQNQAQQFHIFNITHQQYQQFIQLQGCQQADYKVCHQDSIQQQFNNNNNDQMQAQNYNQLDMEIQSNDQSKKQIVHQIQYKQQQFQQQQQNQLPHSSGGSQHQHQQNDGQQMNEQYEEYLHELEDEGINIKNNKGLQNFSYQKQNEKSQNVCGLGQQQARREFRELRKIATIFKSKIKMKQKIIRAGQFYDEEAEEGSDNEQNDGLVKNIDYAGEEKQYEGLNLDADLEEFIDNAVDINEKDQEQAFRKYMEDVKIQDREELKRIMRGDFNRRGAGGERYLQEIQEDQKERLRRMEQIQQYMKQKEQEQGKDLYLQEVNQEEQEEDQDQSDLSSNARRLKEEQKKKKDAGEPEQLDDLNEQNLKRYFDDCLIDHRQKVTSTNVKPLNLYPESYKREKNTLMRNTMKPKQSGDAILPKMKKNTSHLNVMIMKNKQPLKPLAFMKKFNIIGKK